MATRGTRSSESGGCYGRADCGLQPEAFAQEAELNRAYMGGVERGQRNVDVVNLQRIAEALGMSLSELFAEVESGKGQDGDRQ